MRLAEYEGKALFRKYGIETPKGVVVRSAAELPKDIGVSYLKAQILKGDRKNAGGVVRVDNHADAEKETLKMLSGLVREEKVEKVLIEEGVNFTKEYYASYSYDSASRGPVLALNVRGGTGLHKATLFPVDITWGVSTFFLRDCLIQAKFPQEDHGAMVTLLGQLWQVFTNEYALLAEINPIFKREDGALVAGDAKIILDDEKYRPNERRYIEMDGDIAIMASGGGASMLNMDALLRAGGKPANYTEYSGNPKGDVVKELTKKVLAKPGLKGCWVVGAAANFTDIHETLSGFLAGLRELSEKPTYPIVIRRDGPRRAEAFAMLQEAGRNEGFDFHVYDSTTPMIATAKIMVQLAYGTHVKK